MAGKFWADVRTGRSIAVLAERSLQELGALPEQVRSLQEKDLILRLLGQLQQGRYLLAIDNLESVLTTEGDWHGSYEEFLDAFQNLGGESVLLLARREYPLRDEYRQPEEQLVCNLSQHTDLLQLEGKYRSEPNTSVDRVLHGASIA